MRVRTWTLTITRTVDGLTVTESLTVRGRRADAERKATDLLRGGKGSAEIRPMSDTPEVQDSRS